jgi:hypothetical protein
MSGQGVPVESTQSRGPGTFFADHPVLFAFSVGGAWAASAYSLIRLSKTRGWRRFGFMVLGLSTAVEGVGIIGARLRIRN